ncbi:hypothetical protein Dda_7128 [Drechslerella dactyloides]|uniref:Nucleoside phosphorylase domain-containing protein n=1 Tax=Drechslerella dactyloides TaxID=74499 RepID=A0AAD6IT83_DREDA|nr:hypothetical protein Dda_7128 [Drechslerella dactyloides]
MTTELSKSDYSVGWICAISIELAAVLAILDDTHSQPDVAGSDTNVYTFGRIGRHNVVIACLPEGRYSIARAGIVAAHMRSTFPRLRFGLMVGVGGGAPSEENDIRLGDLVVSQPSGVSGGVVQYDFGKAMENGEFVRTGSLNAPPSILLSAVASIKARNQAELGKKISDTAEKVGEKDMRFHYPGPDTDRLFRADYKHVTSEGRHNDTCRSCDASKAVSRPERQYHHPYIHYGIIASGNQVMRDGVKRRRISTQTGALCFEMEAAGLMDDFPCLVIRGVCDYSDGHKNKRWQPYSALIAAIYAKELLLQIPTASEEDTEGCSTPREKIKEINFTIPFCMPLPRNRSFVGRAEELRKVYKYFVESRPADVPRIFALTGTGGMGKTQIALEYAYRHHNDCTAVFWVSAASEDTIRTSFIDIMQRIVKEQAGITWPESAPDYEAIGSKLGMPGLVDSKGTVSADLETVGNIQSALFRWLQLPGNSKWLLIYDNADDLETFNLQEYFPNQGGGAIFVTSRRPEFSDSAKQADLDGLDEGSAVALLLRLADLPDTPGVPQNEAITLVEKLGFMPLAISHAGCYIRETKLPLGKYKSYYEKAFMTVQSKKPRFGWNYRNDTTATTWEVSFLQIEKQDAEAALLLLTCSYLNPEEIFENLWEDKQLDNVKTSQQEKMSRESNKWEGREERRMASHLGYLHRYSKPSFSRFLLQEEHGSGNQTVLDHIYAIAGVFYKQGKYDEAMQWYERALVGRKKALGKDHPDTLSTVHKIASVFSDQGKYDQAMQWCERALAGSEKALGKDHPDTLATVHAMAGVFTRQGKYGEAMQRYERALAGREKALGKDHPDTLDTVHNIAGVFDDQGRYDQAMQWYQRALAGREKAFGKEHPSTLDTVHAMAGVFSMQGKYGEAMQRYERALAGREKALGKDHPDTLATVHAMAGVFTRQGKYGEAMQRYERALAGREKALGKDHPDTLDTVHNIAGVFDDQGKYNEAMQRYERALAGSEKALGKDHPDTLATVHAMAGVFTRQGKYGEAMQRYERALAGSEKALGKDHPDTLATAHAMAGVFTRQGKYGEAMQRYERALAGSEKALGKEHPKTLATAHAMAGVFYVQGKYDEAMQRYERALAGSEKALGKDHPDTLATVHAMAGVFYVQGKYDEAMQRYERALAGSEKALGKDHPDTLATAHAMAGVFYVQGKDGEAMQRYERALAGSEKALGKDHPKTLATVHAVAGVFYVQGRYDEAMQRYERALAGREKALGKDHPDTLDTVHNIAGVFYVQGRYDEAMQRYERALAGREKALGKDHPDTLDTVHNIAGVFDDQGRYDEAMQCAFKKGTNLEDGDDQGWEDDDDDDDQYAHSSDER